MSKKKTHEQFLEELKDKNKNFENIEFLSKYNGVKNRIKCKCKQCGTEWEPIADALKHGSGCPRCAREKIGIASIRSLEDFLSELYKKRDDVEYIDGYASMKKKAKFICKKHNFIFETTPENMLKGRMCDLCRKEKPQYNKLTKEEINKRISNLEVEIIGEYVNSKTLTSFKCKKCGNVFTSKYELIRAWKMSGCEFCKDKTNSGNKGKKSLKKRISKLYSRKSDNVEILSYDENCMRVKCKCKICGDDYETSYDSLIQGSMHRKCAVSAALSDLRLSQDKVMERVKSFGNNILIDFSNYYSTDALLDCKCEVCNHEWKAKQKNLVKGRGCPECAQDKRNRSKYKSFDCYEELLNDMNLTVVSDYINASTPVKLRCNNCGSEFESTLAYISHYLIGCKTCKREEARIEKSIKFISILNKKNETIKLIGEFVDMSTPTTFLCTKCNNIFERTPHDLLKSITCPNCTTNSKLEYFIKLYLDKNKIDYKLHYLFDELHGVNGGLLSYDFYLPKYNLLIEAQGKQHEKPIDYFGGKKSFIIQKEHDKRKYEYALNNKYDFEEIWYYDINNIPDILDTKLNINTDTKKAS